MLLGPGSRKSKLNHPRVSRGMSPAIKVLFEIRILILIESLFSPFLLRRPRDLADKSINTHLKSTISTLNLHINHSIILILTYKFHHHPTNLHPPRRCQPLNPPLPPPYTSPATNTTAGSRG
ncbi:hypothetical protein HanHA89_Chr07g0276721 [Helianthus annuus]|nr:hypothetical protein HanHA89_Chr07g0276721 [Helianthus annuus]